jgi:glycosyltransferase involved in cell wall biosynthesis
MIVRNAEDHLDKTLDSCEFVDFDEIVIVDTGSTDRTPEIAKKRATVFRTYKNYVPLDLGDGEQVLSDFAAARNYARIITSSDYIFWIDSDDVLFNPMGLKGFLDEFIRPGRFDGAMMDYDYSHNEVGQCTLRHSVLRIAETHTHVWKSPIHEVLCAVFEPNKTTVPSDLSRVIHDHTFVDSQKRCARNAAVAKHWIDKLGDKNVEPRLWLNYGKSLVTLGRHEEAIETLHRYLGGSTWNQERYFAHCLCAESCLMKELYEDAYKELLCAVRILPHYADAYFHLGRCALSNDEYKNAIYYAKRCLESGTYFIKNPMIAAAGANRLLAFAYFADLKLEECMHYCDEVLKVDPFDEDTLIKKVIAAKALRKNDLMESYRKLEFMLGMEGEDDKLSHLGKAVPRMLEFEPEIEVMVELPDDKPRIAFLCGETSETWGHDSHLKGGIGGSETAVIHMSKELVKLGWRVEVYGFPAEDQEGEHDGVVWAPYLRYRNVQTPDVLVLWRNPAWLTWDDRCENQYVWLHDIQWQNNWRKQYWETAKAILFLSKAHRQTAPWIPEEKVWYSANGIDPGFFKDGENAPSRCIYASNVDRGLDLLLMDLWPRIREAKPAATLDIYYGFTAMFKEAMKTSERYRQIYKDVTEHLSQPGVTWHGRVGQDVLAQAFADRGVWLYPTSFYEISCITAMQAQANGSIPCVTGFAALSETTRYGKVIGGPTDVLEKSDEIKKRWLETCIDLIGNEKKQKAIRKEMVPWARKNFLWTSVAQDWSRRFKKDLASSITLQPQSRQRPTTPSRSS